MIIMSVFGVTNYDKKLKFCIHSCFQEFQPTNQKNLAKTYFFTFFDPFWQNLKKNLKKISYMTFRSKNRPFLGQNRENEPTVLETLGNYLFKFQVNISKNSWDMIFGRKKIVSAIFAREIRLYSRATQKRKNLKSRNLAFFLVFKGIKYVQSFKTLATVVFEMDRGG